jgi:hypothetical protein
MIGAKWCGKRVNPRLFARAGGFLDHPGLRHKRGFVVAAAGNATWRRSLPPSNKLLNQRAEIVIAPSGDPSPSDLVNFVAGPCAPSRANRNCGR